MADVKKPEVGVDGKPIKGAAYLEIGGSDVPHYESLGLTAKQCEFVEQYILNGANAAGAAAKAGYANPSQAGYILTNNPKIVAAINRGFDRHIMTDGVRMAWGIYKGIMTRTDVKDIRMLSLQAKVARHTLELSEAKRARAEGSSGAGGPGKKVEEMSLEELRQFINSASATLDNVQDVTEAAHKTIEHQELSGEQGKSDAETDE